MIEYIDKELVFYLLSPFFYWAFIYYLYAIIKNYIKSEIIRKKNSIALKTDYPLLIKFSIAIVIGSYFICVVYEKEVHGRLFHLMKVFYMLFMPFLLGFYHAHKSVRKMSREEIKEYKIKEN